ncbi:phage tail protein [Camelimonas lactis]|uniref:GpU protein n=1 Tax=Camelimonas lactis TaxID=659006 RepID=A0A4R2GW38_9HYPH|nr:phage tail protein [Camelimonas lactis]TCO15231.1 GpU protein [Camelimonas lactis]
MGFGWLGPVRMGIFTGPTAAGETAKATLARHNVATGKPVVQDVGDDLDAKKLSFFFDESFCDPVTELGQLQGAMNARQPLPYVSGGGSYTGARYLIESLDIKTLRTTPTGRVVRLEASLTLLECPVQDLVGLATTIARAAAAGISSGSSLNVGARK